MSFKVTPSNESPVFAPSGYSTREQLATGTILKGAIYIQNKDEGNYNKIMLGDLNCTMDKIDRDGGNKTNNF